MSSWSSPKSERRAPSDFLKYLQDISTRRFERETRDATRRYKSRALHRLFRPRRPSRTSARPARSHSRISALDARQLVRAHQRASSSAREVAAEAGAKNGAVFLSLFATIRLILSSFSFSGFPRQRKGNNGHSATRGDHARGGRTRECA
jgi:hypothetical protein